MIKQLTKKKLNNKKGFTLAELLVVIAILAILIAIAIPVFSGMVADANLRVNQANVRSVRSAGVAHILTRLDMEDSSGTGIKLNAGLADGNAWIAIAQVNNNGDVSGLEVYVVSEAAINENVRNGIMEGKVDGKSTGIISDENHALTDDKTKTFATIKPTTGKGNNVYTVQAYITDLDPLEDEP